MGEVLGLRAPQVRSRAPSPRPRPPWTAGSRSRPRRRTSSSVTTGRWLTPDTVARTDSAGSPGRWPGPWSSCRPRGKGRRPGPAVSRQTARVRHVIGLVMLSIQASGQTSAMSSGHTHQYRHVAQRAVHAPGADGVPDRLADAVPGGHVEVDAPSSRTRRSRWSRSRSRPRRAPAAGRWWWRTCSPTPGPRRAWSPGPPSSPAERGRRPRARCGRRGGTRSRAGRPTAPASTGSCRPRRW